jgi:hypothetical protein
MKFVGETMNMLSKSKIELYIEAEDGLPPTLGEMVLSDLFLGPDDVLGEWGDGFYYRMLCQCQPEPDLQL